MKFTQTRLFFLFRHLARVAETGGLRGVVTHAGTRVRGAFGKYGLRGAVARGVHGEPASPIVVAAKSPHPFDLRHGTDTGDRIDGAVLPSLAPSALYITGYIGIPPSTLTQALAALPLKQGDFTFIDLGCGKGRALLVAAQFPFRNILGVELAPELCRVAQANVATNPDWAARITVLNQDAATFHYPDTPLVLFLFNPFVASVLGRVLANLERQLRRSPRETWLLYADNPRFTRVLQRFPFLREVSETSYPFDPEDAAADPAAPGFGRFTLYSADFGTDRKSHAGGP